MRRAVAAIRAFYVKAYTDGITGLAAMVAFNLMLAVFPFALLVLFVGGRVTRDAAVEASLLADLEQLFPRTGRTTLAETVDRVQANSTSLGIVGFIGSVWVGLSFWGALDTAFCRIYEMSCRSWVRQKLFGLKMMGVVVLFIAGTVAVPTFASVLSEGFGGLWVASLVLGLVFVFGGLCIIYRSVPNCPVPLKAVWPGALVATSGFAVVDAAFPLYISQVSTVGQLGPSLVFALIAMLWFYALSLLMLAGAVVNELVLENERSKDMEHRTEELRLAQVEREADERARAAAADEPSEEHTHERRADKAAYLKEKLEQAKRAEERALG